MAGLSDADFGYPAWQGFIHFAFQQPEMREAFTKDTGLPFLTAPTSGIERMIDDASGYHDSFAKAFVIWASRLYGLEYCPPGVQEAANAPIQEIEGAR